MTQLLSVLGLPGNHGLRQCLSQSPAQYISPRRAKRLATLNNVIRWGWWGETPTILGHEFNPVESLSLNKRQQKEKWMEAGVPCVEVVDTITGPCVMRPTRHRQGRHFYIVENNREAEKIRREHREISHWYYMPYHEKKKEYRVHCWFGKVLLTQEKVNTEGRDVPNWNHDQGFVFEVLPWSGIPRGLNHLALDSVVALGLDFGAIDIIFDASGRFLALEANTAPGLTGDYTIERYQQAFQYLYDRVSRAMDEGTAGERASGQSIGEIPSGVLPNTRPYHQPRERKTVWRFDVHPE